MHGLGIIEEQLGSDGCAASGRGDEPFTPQVTGTIGSPSATTTIDGKQLPPPDPAFGGKIENGALQSKPWWAPRIVPPKDAPNVLLIITDDAGFGGASREFMKKIHVIDVYKLA